MARLSPGRLVLGIGAWHTRADEAGVELVEDGGLASELVGERSEPGADSELVG